jgi:hypothetical protein
MSTTHGTHDAVAERGMSVAQVHSLPHSLRHIDKHTALEQAICMAHMLDVFAMSLAGGDWTYADEAKHGLEFFTKLMIDKMEIAAGRYEFPFLTHDRSAPVLAKRNDPEE